MGSRHFHCAASFVCFVIVLPPSTYLVLDRQQHVVIKAKPTAHSAVQPPRQDAMHTACFSMPPWIAGVRSGSWRGRYARHNNSRKKHATLAWRDSRRCCVPQTEGPETNSKAWLRVRILARSGPCPCALVGLDSQGGGSWACDK